MCVGRLFCVADKRGQNPEQGTRFKILATATTKNLKINKTIHNSVYKPLLAADLLRFASPMRSGQDVISLGSVAKVGSFGYLVVTSPQSAMTTQRLIHADFVPKL